jgi:TolA-binding protein
MGPHNDPQPTPAGSSVVENGAEPVATTSMVVTPATAEDERRTDSTDLKPTRINVATVALSLILSLAGGGVGAWAYGRFLSKPEPAPTAPTLATTSPSSAPDPALGDKIKNLHENVESFRDRVRALEDQIGIIPKTQPTAEIRELKAQVADLAKSTEAITSNAKRLESIDDRLDSVERALTAVRTDVERLQVQVGLLRGRSEDVRAGAAMSPLAGASGRREVAKPVSTTTNANRVDLSRGIQLYNDRKYADALTFFEDQRKAHPDDARLWYYSALCRGFATREWGGETERLVKKGVERERAGTPSRFQIDQSFSNLKKEAGRDWLVGFRQKAKAGG